MERHGQPVCRRLRRRDQARSRQPDALRRDERRDGPDHRPRRAPGGSPGLDQEHERARHHRVHVRRRHREHHRSEASHGRHLVHPAERRRLGRAPGSRPLAARQEPLLPGHQPRRHRRHLRRVDLFEHGNGGTNPGQVLQRRHRRDRERLPDPPAAGRCDAHPARQSQRPRRGRQRQHQPDGLVPEVGAVHHPARRVPQALLVHVLVDAPVWPAQPARSRQHRRDQQGNAPRGGRSGRRPDRTTRSSSYRRRPRCRSPPA